MVLRKEKLKVLFLCTANSCRSQMAEGLANALKGDLVRAFSAGVAPAGVNPLAVQVMAEAGIDISSQRSKHVSALAGETFDYVVTLCGSATERCPVFPGTTKVIHVGFDDPAEAAGPEEKRLDAFRRARDALREFVESLPWELEHYQEDE